MQWQRDREPTADLHQTCIPVMGLCGKVLVVGGGYRGGFC